MTQVTMADASDIYVISELIGEIEEHYGGTNNPGETEQIRSALFTPQPAARVLLARDDDGGAVLGMASYSFLWPAAGVETSLYLKELFVRPAARRRGAASTLMASIRKTASEAGCSRVEWTADTDNPDALAFYAALGAERHEGKVFYRAP